MSQPVKRDIRYQGAVIQNGALLLIKHTEHQTGHSYWILPGGGIEPGETEEDCVIRELFEETGLNVEVERLIAHEMLPNSRYYNARKTYLCRAKGGTAAPGYEPEKDVAEKYGITELIWIALNRPESWGNEITLNERLLPQIHTIARTLRDK